MITKDGQKGIGAHDGRAKDGSDLLLEGLFKVPLLVGLSLVLRLAILYASAIPSKLEYRVELTNSCFGLPYSIRLFRVHGMVN